MDKLKQWLNKDVKGALLWIAGIIVAGFFLFNITGCAVSKDYAPEIFFGAAYELSDPVVGANPVGVAGINQPVYVTPMGGITCQYLHLSSIPDINDKNTVDQIGCHFHRKLGRE